MSANNAGKSEKLTLSVNEAARLLGIGRGSYYEAIKRNEVPYIRVGKRLLVPRAALLRMLSEANIPQEIDN